MRRLRNILRAIFWIIFFLGLFFTYSKIKYIRKTAYNNTDLLLQEYNIRKNNFFETDTKKEVKVEEKKEDKSETDKELDKIIEQHVKDKKNGENNGN